jgi:two-component system, OmpR family, response regulator
VPHSNILIIADNTDSAGVWKDALKRRFIESTTLRYGAKTEEIRLPDLDLFDLVLIDSYLESEKALWICGLVRAECDKPVLLLTHEGDERYLLRAYQAGADECIVAPVSVLLFLAKISVWLHRAIVTQYENEEISASGLRLDPKTRQVFMSDGKVIKLSLLEFRLLRLLVANEGRILETEFLLSHVWVHNAEGDRRLLTNLIYRLRQKLESHSAQIANIRLMAGQGYVWDSNGDEAVGSLDEGHHTGHRGIK